ncbi:MAG: ABC transporter permease, partial [Pseudobdellovibrionaceae bacterium]
PFEIFSYNNPDISSSYVGTMGFLYVMSGFFIFLISTAVVLSILNSLTMNILERIREIGTLRALGYSQGKICWMMTQESICLTLICQALGVVLTVIVSQVIHRMNIRFNPPGLSKDIQFDLSPNAFVFLILCLFLLVIISGFSYW